VPKVLQGSPEMDFLGNPSMAFSLSAPETNSKRPIRTIKDTRLSSVQIFIFHHVLTISESHQKKARHPPASAQWQGPVHPAGGDLVPKLQK